MTAQGQGYNDGVAPSKVGAMDNSVPATPSWFIYLRYAQLALTLIVLVCSAVALGAFNGIDGFYVGWGPGFAIFTAVYCLLFLGAVIAVPMFAPQFYFKWFILGAECFAVLWTLVAFSGLAVWASAFGWVDDFDNGFDSKGKTVHGATSAGAAFCAFLWISFIVSLVFYAIGCHQARTAKRSWNAPGQVEAAMGPVPAQHPQPAYDPAPQPVGYGYQS